MNNYYRLIILLFLPVLSNAQSREVILKGTLKVDGGEQFTYKIAITDDDSEVKGFAYTWKDEAKDTKAAITGVIDRKKKTLDFQESGILYNNNFQSDAILCLFQAHLVYKYENGAFTLSGPVGSTDLFNDACSKGFLSFGQEDVLKALFALRPPKETIKTIAPKTADTIVAATAKITIGVETALEWTSDTVVLDIWDGGHIDNDIVSIKYNGITVLSRFTITHNKKQLRLPLTGNGIDVISVIADSEGSEPPNTATLTLTDGRKQYPVVAYNTVGKEAIIRIRKIKSDPKNNK